MQSESQEPVAAIEAAVIALRHLRPRGPGRAGHDGPPWMRGGPHHGADDGSDLEHMPRVRGYRGPHDRTMGGAARFRLLAALRERDGLSVSELAELVGVDQPRASRLVNESAERGLVTRRADERDARRSVVELTEQGRSILSKTNESRRTAVADAVAGFSAEETATFAALLTRFVEGWTR
jgi:DNA-binding MarR family transcriptional regulator